MLYPDHEHEKYVVEMRRGDPEGRRSDWELERHATLDQLVRRINADIPDEPLRDILDTIVGLL